MGVLAFKEAKRPIRWAGGSDMGTSIIAQFSNLHENHLDVCFDVVHLKQEASLKSYSLIFEMASCVWQSRCVWCVCVRACTRILCILWLQTVASCPFRLLAAAEGSRMDDAFLFKSMFTWYREMTNRDQPVTDETITVAAQVRGTQLIAVSCH